MHLIDPRQGYAIEGFSVARQELVVPLGPSAQYWNQASECGT